MKISSLVVFIIVLKEETDIAFIFCRGIRELFFDLISMIILWGRVGICWLETKSKVEFQVVAHLFGYTHIANGYGALCKIFFFFFKFFLIEFSYILAKKSEILTWC